MVFLAILNGIFRESVLAERLSDLRAHQLSCLTGLLLFFAYTWLLSLRWPLESASQALIIGVIWLVLTVAFEFSFGHYVAHHSWGRLFQDYNLMAGRLWVLVLLGVAFLPLIVFEIQG